jgi:hypothetical protein
LVREVTSIAAGSNALLLLGVVLVLATEGEARADQEKDEPVEHTIVLGIGGATELELDDRALHAGADVMVEWDAIENWLELELEVSALAANHGVEVPIGLLFKKPFRVTRRFEFMIGIGPELAYVSDATTKQTYFGGQAALDFMFWLSKRVGLWIEPSYDFIFRDGVSHGIGSTGGLLIGW